MRRCRRAALVLSLAAPWLAAPWLGACATGPDARDPVASLSAPRGGTGGGLGDVPLPPEGLILQYAVTDAEGSPARRGALQVVGSAGDTLSLRQLIGPQVHDRLDFYRGLVPLGVGEIAEGTTDSPTARLSGLALSPQDLAPLWPLSADKRLQLVAASFGDTGAGPGLGSGPGAAPGAGPGAGAGGSRLPSSGPAAPVTLTVTVEEQDILYIQDQEVPVWVVAVDRAPADGPAYRLRIWYSEALGLPLRTIASSLEGGREDVDQVLTVERLILPATAQ